MDNAVKRKYNQAYYTAHAEKLRAYSRQYHAEHPEQCRAACRNSWRQAQELTGDAPYRYMEWLPAEDEMILAKEKTLVEIAHELGRTFSAVSTRRHKLLHPEKYGRRKNI